MWNGDGAVELESMVDKHFSGSLLKISNDPNKVRTQLWVRTGIFIRQHGHV